MYAHYSLPMWLLIAPLAVSAALEDELVARNEAEDRLRAARIEFQVGAGGVDESQVLPVSATLSTPQVDVSSDSPTKGVAIVLPDGKEASAVADAKVHTDSQHASIDPAKDTKAQREDASHEQHADPAVQKAGPDGEHAVTKEPSGAGAKTEETKVETSKGEAAKSTTTAQVETTKNEAGPDGEHAVTKEPSGAGAKTEETKVETSKGENADAKVSTAKTSAQQGPGSAAEILQTIKADEPPPSAADVDAVSQQLQDGPKDKKHQQQNALKQIVTGTDLVNHAEELEAQADADGKKAAREKLEAETDRAEGEAAKKEGQKKLDALNSASLLALFGALF